MGLKPIKVWSPRCRWFNPDGSSTGILPCDPYSRLKYLGRGLRPEIGIPDDHGNTTTGNSLEDAVIGLVGWSGTATELLSILRGSIDDVPADATRLSKALKMLASHLADSGIHVAMTRNRNARSISIMTLDEHVSGISNRS
jgi:hypothetical protein